MELLVYDLVTAAGRGLQDFRVEHGERLTAADGTYQIDATARFRAIDVDFLVLIECKDHARPVGRELVAALADKKRATGAQKAILFATNGFQRGALDYARVHGIALVRVLEGKLIYEVRSANQSERPDPPPWANPQPFICQRIWVEGATTHVWVIERGRTDALAEYLRSA